MKYLAAGSIVAALLGWSGYSQYLFTDLTYHEASILRVLMNIIWLISVLSFALGGLFATVFAPIMLFQGSAAHDEKVSAEAGILLAPLVVTLWGVAMYDWLGQTTWLDAKVAIVVACGILMSPTLIGVARNLRH